MVLSYHPFWTYGRLRCNVRRFSSPLTLGALALTLSIWSLPVGISKVRGQAVDAGDAFANINRDIDEGPTTGQRPLRALAIKDPTKTPVNVVLFMPMNFSYDYSYPRVVPALEIALQEVLRRQLLPNYYLQLRYFNTRCNEADPMNFAINTYIDKLVDVFLGPVCDFSVAPLARQTPFWDIPVISVGANALDFMTAKLSVYTMLTRVGPVNFLRITEFIISQIQHYSWSEIALVYDGLPTSDEFHFFQAQALHTNINKRPGLRSDVDKLDFYLEDYGPLLKKMLGTEKSDDPEE